MSERQAILDALRGAHGSVPEAAHELGIARRTLQRRMREHNIPESKRGRPKKRTSYKRKAKRYAATAAVIAAAAVGGALLAKKS